jgi:hypothetical protein
MKNLLRFCALFAFGLMVVGCNGNSTSTPSKEAKPDATAKIETSPGPPPLPTKPPKDAPKS